MSDRAFRWFAGCGAAGIGVSTWIYGPAPAWTVALCAAGGTLAFMALRAWLEPPR